MCRTVCLLMCCGALIGSVVSAAEWKAEELQELVSRSAVQYIKAFEDHNAEALANMFTSDAEYVDGTGVVFHGRHVIQEEYMAYFESAPKGKLTLDVTSIRPIADSVVIEEGISEFHPENDGPVSFVSYSATHVKQADGEWKLASVRELSEPSFSPHEHLKRIAWLVGSWCDESDDGVVHIDWEWSNDGNFLIGSYYTEQATGKASQGTHRIGWDASRQQFRSWIFTSAGAFAEGTWTQRDGVWEITLSAGLPEGDSASGMLCYERIGADSLIVSQRQRQVAGRALEDQSVRIVRVPPAPEHVHEKKTSEKAGTGIE